MSVQAKHPALLTPGPIEVDDDVLFAMSHNSESHVGEAFSHVFGETLMMLRKLLRTRDPGSQPFVINGSGTLGFDQVASNVLEAGDDVLVLNIGYWGDSFTDCLRTYDVNVDAIKAQIGSQVPLSDIERMLRVKDYKAIIITHVDTATGVLSDIRSISKLVQTISPSTLIVVDGVCSIGCEDIRFDEWQLDIVLGASQKALGAPAGLSILMASPRAIDAFQRRRTPPRAYYSSWQYWLPVMRSYESRQQSAYFATPSSQLIRALHVSLAQILSRPLEERFRQHENASQTVKEAVAALGLAQLATKREDQAHGMTAFWLPAGQKSAQILPLLAQEGVILARGPQKEIAGQYIRFAHMGISVTDLARRDIDRGIQSLRKILGDVHSARED